MTPPAPPHVRTEPSGPGRAKPTLFFSVVANVGEWGAAKLVNVPDLPWPARDNQIKWLTKSGDVIVVFGFGSVLPRIHPDTKNTCPYWLGSQAR